MRIKIEDSSPTITQGSRAEQYWAGFDINYFKKVRPKLKLPQSFKNNELDSIVKKFNLNGIGFGNWLTLEDRVNYSRSVLYALYDLNKVLRFSYNIGLGLLSITFGARGRSGALAHYEPKTDYINITRYRKRLSPSYKGTKEERFFGSGGLGSLAHEYGHFLDYFGGRYLARSIQIPSLSNGDSISMKRTNTGNKMRNLMDDIMDGINWEKRGSKSRYRLRLEKTLDESKLGDYWLRRNELFARAFEVYVLNKLRKQGVRNLLLTGTKYNTAVYMKDSEIQPLIPMFDALMGEIRARIK